MSETVFDAKNLTVRFKTDQGMITAVDNVNIHLKKGQVLGLLGESGSGKSVTLRSILRILPQHKTEISGHVTVGNKDVLSLRGKALANYRGGEVAMIFQEPATAFDPVFTIGHQIAETVVRHKGVSRNDANIRALEMLELVKIPSAKSRLGNYPHEMSGGMRQRAMIALALSCSPKLLLADEPTTALDVTVQIQVILLLRELQQELGMATIFVTHDVGVAAEISDQVVVMYGGRIVERGGASEVLKTPQHSYTNGLLSSTVHGVAPGSKIDAIPGMPPDLAAMPPGCAFGPRCKHAIAECTAAVPELELLTATHEIACTVKPKLKAI